MVDIKQQVGERIKAARLQKGLTQEELGKIIGVNKAAINKYESGKQNLTIETIKIVADALGLKTEVILIK